MDARDEQDVERVPEFGRDADVEMFVGGLTRGGGRTRKGEGRKRVSEERG